MNEMKAFINVDFPPLAVPMNEMVTIFLFSHLCYYINFNVSSINISSSLINYFDYIDYIIHKILFNYLLFLSIFIN